MKYKVTVSVSTTDKDAGEVYETLYLQVLDLDENPAADIARLLNPEPEYEEEGGDEPELTHIERHIENAIQHGIPAGDMRYKANKDFEQKAPEETVPELVSRKGRQRGYNLNQVIDAFERGDSTKDIANDHGVAYATIYQLRRKYEDGKLEREEDDGSTEEPRQEPVNPEPTEYQKARERLEQNAKPDVDLHKKIEEMVAEGLSMAELEMMFPSVPVTTIRAIFDAFEDR